MYEFRLMPCWFWKEKAQQKLDKVTEDRTPEEAEKQELDLVEIRGCLSK